MHTQEQCDSAWKSFSYHLAEDPLAGKALDVAVAQVEMVVECLEYKIIPAALASMERLAVLRLVYAARDYLTLMQELDGGADVS